MNGMQTVKVLPTLEGTRKLRSLLASTHLGLSLLPRGALLAVSRGMPIVLELGPTANPLCASHEDAADNVERACLYYSAVDQLAAVDANVGDALEGQRTLKETPCAAASLAPP